MVAKPPAAAKPNRPYAQKPRREEVAAAGAPVTAPAEPQKPVKLYEAIIAPRQTYSAERYYRPNETVMVTKAELRAGRASGVFVDPAAQEIKAQSNRPFSIEQHANKVGLVDSQVR